MSKIIHLQYYARLREERGCEREQVETDASTPAELYRELGARHGFSLARAVLRVAVNDEFQPWDTSLNDGDSVVFIPPLAGG